MASILSRDQAQAHLLLVVAVLFVSYICVTMPLPVVPVFVTHQLSLNNVLAGLAVGAAFLSTIFTRSMGGRFSNRTGYSSVFLTSGIAAALGFALALSLRQSTKSVTA